MSYTDHFRLADDYVAHLDVVIGTISDPFIKSRYSGFLAVSAVTVYELAIKNVFIEFASQKHKILGSFTSGYFQRMNGRIRVQFVRDEYVKKFGEKYVKRIRKGLDKCEKDVLRRDAESVTSCYENIITWRNDFAHEGRIPATATYEEVRKAYTFGKQVIHCLATAMHR